MLDQNRAPLMEALTELRATRVVPFDVPGHKRGKGNPELMAFLGRDCLSVDVNSMKPLDNLCHPVSVIAEAEALAAEAFQASNAFFMVGGTTSSVQSMVLQSCKPGEELILPRNVHRSAINALILSGAVPVYVNPGLDERLGISLGMRLKCVRETIHAHPNAKAVFINNPTYYGICSNIRAIAETAHEHRMLLLADEAHGTHFSFGRDMPPSAMAAGADMAAVSMHKSGGSLTQSSLLLTGPHVNADQLRQVVNLTQTTSGSYLLLVSLDISRKNLALNADTIFARVQELTSYARNEINQIGDYYAYGTELVNGDSIFAFDETKLCVNTLGLGLAGIEVYDILRDEYDIQAEFGDLGNILAYISVGDRERDIERLVGALADIRRRYKRMTTAPIHHQYMEPDVCLSPREAFYADKESMPADSCAGQIAGEFVMSYPPGIPILAPGERITPDILSYIQYAKEKGCTLTGPEDLSLERLRVIKGGHLCT